MMSNTTSNTTTTSRYSKPRTLLRWDKTPHLQILKMLAWIIFDREHVRSAAKLEARVALLFDDVVEAITGETGITLQMVKDATLAAQGAPITAEKLLQRADKTDRYVEWNDYVKQVKAAYEKVLLPAVYS